LIHFPGCSVVCGKGWVYDKHGQLLLNILIGRRVADREMFQIPTSLTDRYLLWSCFNEEE